MTINQNILMWSKDLPAWQRDALRRIYQGSSLTAEDIDELYAIANEDPSATTSAVALDSNHMSSAGAAGVVRILRLADLTGVNAFPPGRGLDFERDGITVVFGENGAGKSGYARVLKRACRARSAEPVRGNVFDAKASNSQASATIHLEIDGAPANLFWVDGTPPDSHLSSVLVYDSACASDYLEEEGQPTFQPYGLRALNLLGRACQQLDSRLSSELEKCRPDAKPFEGLKGEHAVGKFIGSLSRTSDVNELRELSALTDAEHVRLKEISQILSQSDPEPQAKLYERLASRVSDIGNRLERADAYISQTAVEKLSGLLEQSEHAAAALEASKSLLQERQNLTGTGGDAWTQLIAAARKFSIDHAFPARDFPYLEEDARCVLCQGELNERTRENLKRFAAFVSSEAAKKSSGATDALETARRKIEQASCDLAIDDATRAELADQGSEILPRIEVWARSWEARRSSMLRAQNSSELSNAPLVPSDAANAADIRRLSETLRSRAKEIRGAGDPGVRAALIREHAELTARVRLTPFVPAIEKFISDAKRTHILSGVKGKCSSLAISKRMTELAEKYVTDQLLEGMREELSAIGYMRSAKHKIPKRTSKGVTLCRVALDGTDAEVADVLSEGEQRATSFAFFLAELRLSEKKSTLVFDDPVTSMDHRYRRQIAHRLARLALERQIIVFTHDAVFLTYLQRASMKLGCNISARHIEWNGGAPGAVKVGLGWDVADTGQRLQRLEEDNRNLRDQWGEYPNEDNKRAIANLYDNLRGAMERMMREFFLNEVIVPYSDEVKVENFEAVIGVDPKEWEQFIEIYDRACGAMLGHDTPAEVQAAPPTCDQLFADIQLLRQIIASAKARRRMAHEKQNARRELRRKGVERLGSEKK